MEPISLQEILDLKKAGKIKSLRWRKSYGDGEETDDTVLWINGRPTVCCVSGLSSQCRCAMIGLDQIGFYQDTNKECKEILLQELGLSE